MKTKLFAVRDMLGISPNTKDPPLPTVSNCMLIKFVLLKTLSYVSANIHVNHQNFVQFLNALAEKSKADDEPPTMDGEIQPPKGETKKKKTYL